MSELRLRLTRSANTFVARHFAFIWSIWGSDMILNGLWVLQWCWV